MGAHSPKLSKSLRYTSDTIPGIRRQKKGRNFIYREPKGKIINAPKILARIENLSIPPAYSDVWICPHDNGHLQATGRDSKQRKQYFYHPKWIKWQTTHKFERVYLFGITLPLIRKKIAHDLRQHCLNRTCVLAALVRIMDKSYVRVGNETYAKEYRTFGLTTLRKRHARVYRDQIAFQFEGKNQTPWHIRLEDSKVARVVKKCTDIPGYELFKYIDEDRKTRTLCSEDFNAYLQQISGHDFTAKDFRTWAACKETFCLLTSELRSENELDRQKVIKNVLKTVAHLMGHTIAICKKAYIHPVLLKSWETGALQTWVQKRRLRNNEKLFLKWWKEHIKGDKVG